jgi:polyketide biosynthesis enoyl-CoA hydratase PksH
MVFESILVKTSAHIFTVTLDRPARRNTLTDVTIAELHTVLDQAELLPGCRMVVIQGTNGVFCTGMDMEEAATQASTDHSKPRGARFFHLLRRFTTSPRIIVSIVDGRVVGGGVGLTAASDFVFATERAQFGLPETLWGLLPCAVAPFLLRRAGFQASYAMTLSTLPVNAHKAERLGLVDEVCKDPNVPLQQLASRAAKLDQTTIAAAKRYYNLLWPISEKVEAAALNDFDNLFSSSSVQKAITAFTGPNRSFPWEL